MANHKQPVPEWLNSNYMQDILRKSLKSPDLEVESISVSPGSKVGDNYACQIFRILVVTNENGKRNQLSIIGKFMAQTRLIESVKFEFDVFEIESKFFNSLLPILRKHLSPEDDIMPVCYMVDEVKNIIFLEDLVPQQYKLQTRKNFLSKEQCVLVIEALAALHGASHYALKEDPNLKKTYHKSFWSSQKNEPLEKLCQNTQKGLEQNIEKYGLSVSHCEKLIKFLPNLEANGWCQVCDLQEGKLNFLLHGDSWMNNMMFRFKNDVPESVKLLDFQIVNYNSFANDLQYCLFSSADTNVLLNDIDYLLECYYTKLRKVAPDIPGLSLARIKSEFAERYYFGYLMVVMFRPFLLSEEPPDMEEIMDGICYSGYDEPSYISDLQQLLPLLEKLGGF